MATFVLTWNPRRFEWSDLAADIAEVDAAGFAEKSWSCGNTRRIEVGDRVFLLRQGPNAPGIVGRGWVSKAPYQDKHWKDSSKPTPRTAISYVGARWDILAEQPMISRSRLDEHPFRTVNWRTRASGIQVPTAIADKIDDILQIKDGLSPVVFPDEVDELPFEGFRRRIAVNVFERSASARKACLKHYGSQCSVCEVDFGARYGSVADGLIHVHHLVPVSRIRERYRINPVKDLRPVCPNCHAVLHLNSPPFTIDELRSRLEKLRAEAGAHDATN